VGVGVAVGAVVGVVVGSPGDTVSVVPEGEVVPDTEDSSDGSEGEPAVELAAVTELVDSDTMAEDVVDASGSMRGFENIESAPRMDTNASERSKATPMTVRMPSPGFR
jgi:hypothetical protein